MHSTWPTPLICQLATSKATSSPTRHEAEALKAAKSRSRRPDIHRSVAPCAVNRHHLPGPLPRHTTVHPRATTPPTQPPATHAAQGDRPQTTSVAPLPGPLPRHIVQPSTLERVDRDDDPATLTLQPSQLKIATQAMLSCNPTSWSCRRIGFRDRRLGAQIWGRCPAIH